MAIIKLLWLQAHYGRKGGGAANLAGEEMVGSSTSWARFWMSAATGWKCGPVSAACAPPAARSSARPPPTPSTTEPLPSIPSHRLSGSDVQLSLCSLNIALQVCCLRITEGGILPWGVGVLHLWMLTQSIWPFHIYGCSPKAYGRLIAGDLEEVLVGYFIP